MNIHSLSANLYIGFKEKRAPADEQPERAKSPVEQNNERPQNDEREVHNPERQDEPAQTEKMD